MKIKLHEIPIKCIADGYSDDERGVTGCAGKLDIRPAFQREFIYNDAQRDEVVRTVMLGFPIGVMYRSAEADGKYELVDGQQRITSICRYVRGDFAVDGRSFADLTEDERTSLLGYGLMMYTCEGTEKEKLDRFRAINVAGTVLTEQELRNAACAGPWLTEMKRLFCKEGCRAEKIASDLMDGTPIRQDYLETVLRWLCDRDGIAEIEEYMCKRRYAEYCTAEWTYFESVVKWTKKLFPAAGAQMKGIGWGLLYNRYKDNAYSPKELGKRVAALLADDDVTEKKGVYEYVLGGDESCLRIREFSPQIMNRTYTRQQGICPECGRHFEPSEMVASRVTPWRDGGHTVEANCRMLCRRCGNAHADE